MKSYLLTVSLLLMVFFFSSCEKYREDILPLAGVYEANVVGVSGPFSVSISVDYGNNVLIDAPWDGEIWSVIEAHIRNEGLYRKIIRISAQNIGDGVRIWGEGIWYDYTFQLEYTIRIDGINYDYTLIGSKI